MIIVVVAFLSGIFASMGLGGGMVLIIWLAVFTETTQIVAQGINLVFFIPIAVLSLILHTKAHLVEWKIALPAIVVGTLSAVLLSIVANRLHAELLQKAFGAFIIIVGFRELFAKKSS